MVVVVVCVFFSALYLLILIYAEEEMNTRSIDHYILTFNMSNVFVRPQLYGNLNASHKIHIHTIIKFDAASIVYTLFSVSRSWVGSE